MCWGGWGSVFCEITSADDSQLLLGIVVAERGTSRFLNAFSVLFLLVFVVSFISIDDAGDELVADDVLLGGALLQLTHLFRLFRPRFPVCSWIHASTPPASGISGPRGPDSTGSDPMGRPT